MALGVIGDLSPSLITTRRLQGIQDAIAGRTGVGWRAYMREDAHDEASAKNVVAAWLGSRSAPSALITLSATVTQGAIDACRRLGEWPALVGIDDFPTAELLDVTVVDRNVESLAAEAVRRLRSGAEPTDSGGGEGRLGEGGNPHPSETTGRERVDDGVPEFDNALCVIARGSGEEPPDTR